MVKRKISIAILGFEEREQDFKPPFL